MTKFNAFMKEIKQEAKAEGPEALVELKRLEQYYRKVRKSFSNKQEIPLA
jgi:hypothetical protein